MTASITGLTVLLSCNCKNLGLREMRENDHQCLGVCADNRFSKRISYQVSCSNTTYSCFKLLKSVTRTDS